MPALALLTYPDDRLKQRSLPVTTFDDELRTFAADLEATMEAGPGSVGIAAPQVGRFQRLFVVDVSGAIQRAADKGRPLDSSCNGRLMVINPELISNSGEDIGREGCMSVPDFTGNVARPTHIRFAAHDLQGQRHEYDCHGFEARAVLHEMDHLDGLLFLDRLVSPRALFRRKVYVSKSG